MFTFCGTKRVLGCIATGALLASGCDIESVKQAGLPVGINTFLISQKIDKTTAHVKYTSNVSDATFQCKLDVDGEEGEWNDCPSNGTKIDLKADSDHKFSVKAQDKDGQQDESPAEVEIKAGDVSATESITDTESAAESNGLTVEGTETLQQAKSGKITVKFKHPKATGYICAVDGEEEGCDEGAYTVDIDALAAGPHKLSISAVVEDKPGEPITINFCAATCEPGTASKALADTLQIGDFYTATISLGMHITEYSTTKTTGWLSFYRIMNYSDPYYLGYHKCDKDHQALVQSTSPSGDVYDYCHSTPLRSAYKSGHEYRLANNHIEFATDPDLVTATHHERISVSVYDRDWELMSKRSRFLNLCRNAVVKRTRLPLINDFFRGRHPEDAMLYYCDTIIPAANGQPEFWKVGAFYDVDSLDWNCGSCRYDRAVEVVYMARPETSTWRDDYFAKQAQTRILDHLQKVQP